jgi:predicted transcriptional regulator
MTSQSPRDRILWILANSGGKLERSRLMRCAGMRYALLDLILAKLAKEGRIRIGAENMISLKEDSFSLPARTLQATTPLL